MQNNLGHVFREYDIRGFVDTELSTNFATQLGKAYGHYLNTIGTTTGNIALGHDCRLSSPSLCQALAEGITSVGFDVTIYGVGPTPQLYFSVFTRDHVGGIQVTGSHNPPDMNGFKMMAGNKTLSGPAIAKLRDIFHSDMPRGSGHSGEISETSIRESYLQTLVDNVRPHLGQRKVKLVVDAGNGVGGLVGPELLRSLGAEVIELYCEPDGTFPNHHPDPTVMENIVDLQEAVIAHNADAGIGWDGDADRIGVVDENGQVIYGDMLVLLYATAILKNSPGETIIGDVKCSSRLFEEVKNLGGVPIMYKTGHSLMKEKLFETKAALAGEMSGHIFFHDRFFGFDDAMYASARILEILSNREQPLSAFFDNLPQMYATPEIRVDCDDDKKFLIPKKLVDKFSSYKTDTTDGIRISFEKGWGLVRASNTQSVLVLRFEAEDAASLAEYETIVRDAIASVG